MRPTITSPRRILQIISTLEGGGGANALELVRGFQGDDRFDVRLCVLGVPPANFVKSPRDPIEFLEAPVHHRRLFLRRMFGLRRLLSTWKPDLIHTQLWPTALTAGLIAPWSLPHLIHIYDTPPSLKNASWGATLRRSLLRRWASNPNVYFASVSSAAASYSAEALQIDPGRIRTIVNGVQLDRFLATPALKPHPDRPFVIACAGRLVADKGFDLVLNAIGRIAQPRDKFQVRIAGTGSAEPALRGLCQELGIADRVEFVGHIENMPGFLERADIFVHSAIAAEGLARVLIESQAAGRPVVTSEHAGANEAIDEGSTGFVVPAGDARALAKSIELLMRDPNRLMTMGAAARTRAATHFAVERVIEEVASLYSEMLS